MGIKTDLEKIRRDFPLLAGTYDAPSLKKTGPSLAPTDEPVSRQDEAARPRDQEARYRDQEARPRDQAAYSGDQKARPGNRKTRPGDQAWELLGSPAHKFVYLDNAATTQKPRVVIDALANFYKKDNANVDRGAYELSARAGEQYGYARAKVMNFIGAKISQEIIFTRGTTESINLVAASFGGERVTAGDEIIVSRMEHHSNLVPWQILARQKKAKLRVIKITDRGELDLTHYQKLIGPKTRLIAVTHVSNVLGTINPIKKIVALAHERNIPVLVDGAQAVGHLPVDVDDLDCDFYAFSGHKVYGPMGIGVLYAKKKWLEQMPPYQTGGGMICAVEFDKTKFRPLPHKFEAGTPNIAGAVALRAALKYVEEIGFDKIRAHEQALLAQATTLIQKIPCVKILGTASQKIGVLSLAVKGVHPHDLGTLLDQNGIAVRTGHHCAQPLSWRFGVEASLRLSLGLYNTSAEIEYFARELKKAINFLK